jgi:hypothetical protein
MGGQTQRELLDDIIAEDTRLIDRHGPTMLLSKLAEILSADCPNRRGDGYFRRCGVYFPDAKGRSDAAPASRMV